MRLFFFLAAFFCVVSAVPSKIVHTVVHERRAVGPHGWTQTRKLENDEVLQMRIGLTQQNTHRIDEMLMAVAHPDSPTYGQHYSPAQVVDAFAPSIETVKKVTAWLTTAGISANRLRLSSNKGWLHLNVTVSEAEKLLDAEYHMYTHSSGDKFIGCQSYAVPAKLNEHIDLVYPGTHFSRRPSPQFRQEHISTIIKPPLQPRGGDFKSVSPPSLVDCDEFITPACLRVLYSIHYTPVSINNNSFGVVEFAPQAFLGNDLDLFFRNFSPSLVGVRPHVALIDDAVLQTSNQSFDFNGESDLDLQYAMTIVDPQPVTLLQVAEGGSFDNWLDAVDASFCTFEGGDDPTQETIFPDGIESCGIMKPPHVVSLSYGQDEVSGSLKFLNRQCNEYAKLGLMGTSVFYSSGDDGVAGNGGICLDSSHIPVNSATNPGTVFNPDFPATCPYVTSVGATQINPGSTVADPESACEQVIFSGGGFSNVFPMPSYQAQAVTHFLTAHPPPYCQGEFNNSGFARAFPDLSANGANYVFAFDSNFTRFFGTSASAPVVASIFTLINDARLNLGKNPVGFVNPAIYSAAFRSAFNDIVSGGNQGCGTPGFNATTGWDPVTGVGTPNLTKLLPLFLALP